METPFESLNPTVGFYYPPAGIPALWMAPLSFMKEMEAGLDGEICTVWADYEVWDMTLVMN